MSEFEHTRNIQDVYDVSRPYRWAAWLNDAVIEYCSTSDYTIGRIERDDIATDIINQNIEVNALSAEEAYEYLIHWRSIYNHGFSDEKS